MIETIKKAFNGWSLNCYSKNRKNSRELCVRGDISQGKNDKWENALVIAKKIDDTSTKQMKLKKKTKKKPKLKLLFCSKNAKFEKAVLAWQNQWGQEHEAGRSHQSQAQIFIIRINIFSIRSNYLAQIGWEKSGVKVRIFAPLLL